MTTLVFNRSHALQAIELAESNGRAWLYRTYPKPDGHSRLSTTGFLIHGGITYPLKPLGRLANEIAGTPMIDNPITTVFRRHFEGLGFQLTNSAEAEAEIAAERQRRLAAIWERPGQAKFRREVFERFGSRCLVTGCDSLVALEAAHIVPVSQDGCDNAWNGIPLRADLHRLFDAGLIYLNPDTWTLHVGCSAGAEYRKYDGLDLTPFFAHQEGLSQLSAALRKRSS